MKKQLGNRIISWLLALGMIMSPTGAGLTAVPVFAEESGIVEPVEEDNITTDENVSDEEETPSSEGNDIVADENNPTEDVLPSEGDNIAEETQSLDADGEAVIGEGTWTENNGTYTFTSQYGSNTSDEEEGTVDTEYDAEYDAMTINLLDLMEEGRSAADIAFVSVDIKTLKGYVSGAIGGTDADSTLGKGGWITESYPVLEDKILLKFSDEGAASTSIQLQVWYADADSSIEFSNVTIAYKDSDDSLYKWTESNDGSLTLEIFRSPESGEKISNYAVDLVALLEGTEFEDVKSIGFEITEFYGNMNGGLGIEAPGFTDNWASVSWSGTGKYRLVTPNGITASTINIQHWWSEGEAKVTFDNFVINPPQPFNVIIESEYKTIPAASWEEAAEYITDPSVDYIVEITTISEIENFVIPKTAASITFVGEAITIGNKTLAIPVDTTFSNEGLKSENLSVTVAAGKTLTVSSIWTEWDKPIANITGTATSKFITNASFDVVNIKNFETVDSGDLRVSGTMSGIKNFTGCLHARENSKITIDNIINSLSSETYLTYSPHETIPTVNNISEGAKLVLNCAGGVSIQTGTTVLYSPKDISSAIEIGSYNHTEAFYYPKTKEIKAENPDAVSLSKNGDLAESFQNLDAAFAAVTDKTADYTIEINDDIEIENLVIPKTANSITFTGDGRITMANKKLVIPVNTTFDVFLAIDRYILGEEIHKIMPETTITVAAGKKLTVNKEWLYHIDTITGTKTSELVLNAGASFDDVKNFGTVTAVDLSLWNNMSGIGNFSGNLTSNRATVTIDNISANSDIHIWNSNTKLTVNSIAENAVLTLTVDEDAALASGTTVLYSKNNISPNVKIANKTADGDELSAYYYTKTKSIKAEVGTALTLSYGNFEKSYPNFELLFADITDKNVDYTITLNTDMFVEKLTFPKTAKSITINGAQLGFDNKTVAIPVDMTIATERFAWSIGEITEELPAGQGYTLTVAAGKTLTINSNVCDVKAITGTKTSKLNIIGDGTVSVYDLKTFENVTTAPSAWLCVRGSMSAVSNFSGRLIFSPTIKSKDVAISNIAADSLIQAWIYDNQKHKITVNAIAENATLTYRAWVNDSTGDLANGTTILYAPKDITEQIVIENKTESGKSLKPFYYKKTKEIKAEVAEAITLSDGTTENNYPNLEKAFENITDSTKNYTITLYEDVKSEKLTLPKTAASITIRSDNLSTINVGKLTSITANTDLTIENIAFETSGKTLTINAKKNLTVDGLYGNVTALKGGAKFALNWLGEDEGLFADITGFGTVNIAEQLTTGKVFNATNLVFKSATATLVISDAAAKVSVKAINAASGGIIKYAEGAKTALAFTGKDAAFTGTLTITGAVANGQAVLTAKDISLDKLTNGIAPANVNVEYGFTQVGNNICYMGKVIALNSDNSTEKYALWSEVVAVIEKAKNAKADYEITLLDNYNFNGAIKLPKAGTYKSITIDGADLYELTFTGNIALTGNLNIENTTTVCTTKTGAESPFKINAGKYSLTLTEVITGACTISGSTGSVITLNDVKINGSVSGDTVICNGTDMVYIAGNLAAKKSLVANDSIFIRGNINAYALSSTSANGADFEFSHGKKITIGKGGITAGELSFRVVDSDFHLDAIEDGEVIGTIAGAISSNASVEVYGADDFEGTLKAVKGKLIISSEAAEEVVETGKWIENNGTYTYVHGDTAGAGETLVIPFSKFCSDGSSSVMRIKFDVTRTATADVSCQYGELPSSPIFYDDITKESSNVINTENVGILVDSSLSFFIENISTGEKIVISNLVVYDDISYAKLGNWTYNEEEGSYTYTHLSADDSRGVDYRLPISEIYDGYAYDISSISFSVTANGNAQIDIWWGGEVCEFDFNNENGATQTQTIESSSEYSAANDISFFMSEIDSNTTVTISNIQVTTK
ncbi:MAG: hypothetical protein IJC04_03870 [Oscillospiraceae bacterium]|nr:hypothetical protein [Oscillospiraceae bacterium]